MEGNEGEFRVWLTKELINTKDKLLNELQKLKIKAVEENLHIQGNIEFPGT